MMIVSADRLEFRLRFETERALACNDEPLIPATKSPTWMCFTGDDMKLTQIWLLAAKRCMDERQLGHNSRCSPQRLFAGWANSSASHEAADNSTRKLAIVVSVARYSESQVRLARGSICDRPLQIESYRFQQLSRKIRRKVSKRQQVSLVVACLHIFVRWHGESYRKRKQSMHALPLAVAAGGPLMLMHDDVSIRSLGGCQYIRRSDLC